MKMLHPNHYPIVRQFLDTLPIEFKHTKFAKLPSRSAANAALRWLFIPALINPNPASPPITTFLNLILSGPASSGKSRIAYLIALANVRFNIHGNSPSHSTKFIHAHSLARHIIDAALDGSINLYLNSLYYAHLLVIDDIDLIKYTPVVERSFLQILDTRCLAKIPTVITISIPLKQFKATLSCLNGPKIIGRILNSFGLITL